MEIKWTDKQSEAIETTGKNLLVSAAAGSGKTAVLVERIKRMVLEGTCSIDHMLIVTFTNAAAEEMKEKIEKALNAAIKSAKDEQTIRKLKEQLDLIPRANISTFHSFALDVIRRYFYVIKREPNFKIADDTQQTLLMKEAMDELLEGRYAEGDAKFYDFLNKHSGDRNDNKLREMIENTYKTIQSLPEPFKWLDEKVAFLNADEESFKESPVMKAIFDDCNKRLNRAIENLENNREWALTEGLSPALELINTDLGAATTLKASLETRDFDAVKTALESFNLPKLLAKYYDIPLGVDIELDKESVKACLEDGRDALKATVKLMRENYFYDSLLNLRSEIADTYEDSAFLVDLVKEFNQLYQGKKADKGLADFNDIEHWAYDILCDEEAAKYYRNKFDYIYIDEYQDSNILQDALIAKIKRDNNLFMVGDIKQSIYKFRLAKPEIFKEKYDRYGAEYEEQGDASKSKKIDLNSNFRSKKTVIDFVNDVFEDLMAGYDKNAKLYPGDENADKGKYQPKLYLANAKWDGDDEKDLDDDLKNYIKAEKEALATVKVIKDYLGKPFFDSKEKVERPLELKDIVILMRGIKSYGEQFYKILTSNGIATYIDDNDGFFDTIEIDLVMALLAIIDNEKQDVPLLTVMRSEVWKFTVNEMIEIRLIDKSSSYHDALVKYAEFGSDAQLKSKCETALNDLNLWRHSAKRLPLEEFVWNLILESGIYIAMGALPAGAQRQANLRAFADKALNYRTTADGSLYGFMSYIAAIKDGKVSMGQVKMVSEGDKTVRIMTIHKSKGLEFPMVIVAGYGRKLNYDSVRKNATIHDELGIALPIVNYKESWYKTTLLQNVVKQKIHTAEVEEEQRVLYVALTRARDILALVGIVDDPYETIKKIRESATKDTSYLTMTGRTIAKFNDTVRVISNAELKGISEGKKRASSKALALMDLPESAVDAEIEKRMTYAYPKADLEIKSKYSVSELNTNIPVQERTLREPASHVTNNELTPAQIGTVVHKVLELIDFRRASTEGEAYIAELVESMIRDEHIAENEKAAVDCKKLAKFAQSELGGRIAASDKIVREQSFNLKMEVNGSETLVQGIIDCFFIENGKAILIDYKTTKRRDEESIRAEYQTQIDIYKQAITEATDLEVSEAYIYLTDSGKVVEM